VFDHSVGQKGQRLEAVQLPEGPQLDRRVLEAHQGHFGAALLGAARRLVQVGGGRDGQVDAVRRRQELNQILIFIWTENSHILY